MGMRVRIPTVVSDLRTIPDPPPNVRLTAVSTEPTLPVRAFYGGIGCAAKSRGRFPGFLACDSFAAKFVSRLEIDDPFGAPVAELEKL